jgi:hypothetical protein
MGSLIMKSKKLIDTIKIDVPPIEVMVSVGFSYDEIIKELKKQECDQWLEGLSEDKSIIDGGNYFALSRTIENEKSGKRTYLLYLIIKERFKFRDSSYCILAHECLHIVQYVMDIIGGLGKEKEFEAYLHTALMSKCLELMRKHSN